MPTFLTSFCSPPLSFLPLPVYLAMPCTYAEAICMMEPQPRPSLPAALWGCVCVCVFAGAGSPYPRVNAHGPDASRLRAAAGAPQVTGISSHGSLGNLSFFYDRALWRIARCASLIQRKDSRVSERWGEWKLGQLGDPRLCAHAHPHTCTLDSLGKKSALINCEACVPADDCSGTL